MRLTDLHERDQSLFLAALEEYAASEQLSARALGRRLCCSIATVLGFPIGRTAIGDDLFSDWLDLLGLELEPAPPVKPRLRKNKIAKGRKAEIGGPEK